MSETQVPSYSEASFAIEVPYEGGTALFYIANGSTLTVEYNSFSHVIMGGAQDYSALKIVDGTEETFLLYILSNGVITKYDFDLLENGFNLVVDTVVVTDAVSMSVYNVTGSQHTLSYVDTTDTVRYLFFEDSLGVEYFWDREDGQVTASTEYIEGESLGLYYEDTESNLFTGTYEEPFSYITVDPDNSLTFQNTLTIDTTNAVLDLDTAEVSINGTQVASVRTGYIFTVEVDQPLVDQGDNSVTVSDGNYSYSANLHIVVAVDAPIFSVVSGTFNTEFSLEITSATPDASLYYTTNGQIPTTADPLYSGEFQVGVSQQVRAIAVKAGMLDSLVVSETYVFEIEPLAFGVAPGVYITGQAVEITTPTPGVSIYYTTDGTTPTTSSTLYTGSVTVGASVTLKALAKKTGWTDSEVLTGVYTITGTVAAPTFDVDGGSYLLPQTVSLATDPGDAIIYYTLNGDTPDGSSTEYTTPIQIGATTTVKAIALKPLWAGSAISEVAYSILGQAAELGVRVQSVKKLEFRHNTLDNLVNVQIDDVASAVSYGVRYITVDQALIDTGTIGPFPFNFLQSPSGNYAVVINDTEGTSAFYGTEFTVVTDDTLQLNKNPNYPATEPENPYLWDTMELGDVLRITFELIGGSTTEGHTVLDSNSLTNIQALTMSSGFLAEFKNNNIFGSSLNFSPDPSNINSDPLYKNPVDFDYSIDDASPNRLAGNPSYITRNKDSLSSRERDLSQVDRTYKGEPPDIGALENLVDVYNRVSENLYMSQIGHDYVWDGNLDKPVRRLSHALDKADADTVSPIMGAETPHVSKRTQYFDEQILETAPSRLDIHDSRPEIPLLKRTDRLAIQPFDPKDIPGDKVFVTVDGNDDTGNGSLGNPYRTIQRALQETATVICVLAGDYPLFTGVVGKSVIFLPREQWVYKGASGVTGFSPINWLIEEETDVSVNFAAKTLNIVHT
jgi:hypothetical protein